MEQWLQKQWYRFSLWHLMLIPLSWLFSLLTFLRRFGYRIGVLKTHRLPVPVIVVGNISIGGTGKTPLVTWLVQVLRQHGYHPAVISRGYGGVLHEVIEVTADSDPAIVGDEPVLLARRANCPVWVGRDRVEAARYLLQAHPQSDVIISDDGLQHYRLQRDFEIAVVDGSRGIGNGCLLPAGPLRESKARLKTVDAVVVNGGRADSPAFAMQLESGMFHNLLDSTKVALPAEFTQRTLYAIAGIGNPARFFQQLNDLGLQFKRRAFPDHYRFSLEDLQTLDAEALLMTEKDAVKCAAFAQPNWWYLPVSASVDQALLERILHKLRK